MAARKLQTEIDRTLKKVSEGVDLFESIYEKMQNSTNQTQKEKLEMDLKTQIKKLQRLRDQIKTWAASNDIKDKSALVDNRRLIETQMEKFKACEKEMKTKAFSKEGLIQSAKLDPKQQEKLDITSWIQTRVEDLQLQVEHSEAEIESLQATGGKKKGKAGGQMAERLEELERLNERRKWHISRLEIILRLLDNGSMATEKIVALKEDVQYFVDSNTDEEFDEDEGIYDELNLDEEEEKFGIAADESSSAEDSEEASEDLPPRTPSKKQHEEESPGKRDGSPVLKKANVTLQLRKPSSAADSPKPPPNPNFAQQPMASILKAGLPPAPRQPVPLPPIRYAAAAAAAVATPSPSTSGAPSTTTPSQPSASPHVPSATPSILSPFQQQQSTSQDLALSSSSPSLTHPSMTSPMLSSASASALQQDESSYYSHQEDSPALSEAVSASVGPSSASPQRERSRSASISSHVMESLSRPLNILSTETVRPLKREHVTASDSPMQPIAPAAPIPVQAAPAPALPTATATSALSPLPQQVLQYPLPSLTSAMPSTNAPPTPSPLPQTQNPGQTQTLPQFPPGVKVQEQQQHMQVPMQAVGAQRPPSQGQSIRPSAPPQLQPPQPGRTTAFPGSLSDLVVSFENVKQKAVHRMSNLDQVHKLLDGSYSSMPQPQDTEKPKYYVPRNYYPAPAYYPQTPNPILSTAGLFSQLDVETLFYVFYYHPGTYLQYLAAKELKRQSWRFHVKYLTWFQRHSEPQAITEEYEQGVYVYFDWEGSWCQRKKSDFRFEYRYLSED